jgi:CubicO group peptidase (beta-lactamase class C family)
MPDDDVEVATTDQPLWQASGPNGIWRVLDHFQDTAALRTRTDQLVADNIDIDAIAVAPGGQWIIVTATQVYQSPGFPAAVRDAVDYFRDDDQRIHAVDVNEHGDWVVAAADGWLHSLHMPGGIIAKVNEYYANDWSIRDLDLLDHGYVLLGEGDKANWRNIDPEMEAVLEDRIASKRTVQLVDVGYDDRWVVVSGQEAATEGVSTRLADRLRINAGDERMTSRFTLGLGDDYIVFSNGQAMPDTNSVIDQIEYNVGPTQTTIWRRMTDAKIPGLAIALIENNRITHVRGYGVLRAGQQRHVLATTPFDLASMSKFPSALTLARLNELGKIDLDADILTSPGTRVAEWQERGEATRPDLPVGITLRRLLSHTSGIRAEGGSPGVPQRNWEHLPLDIVDQLMGFTCRGVLPPCRFEADKLVWTDAVPGRVSQYASGNFLLAEAVVQDATGTTGAERIFKVIIENLGLQDTSAETLLPVEFERRAAWQHGQDGARLSRTVYPWTFAGGMYASAGDYARMMILALDEGRDERGIQRIRATGIADMLTRVTYVSGGQTRMGRALGLSATGVPGEGLDGTFHHGGRHGAEARNEMCGNPDAGDGIVVLTNSDSDPDGNDVVQYLIDDIIAAYRAQQSDWAATVTCD